MKSPEEIVQSNLDAYNLRNIDDFMRWFDSGIEIAGLGSTEKPIKGLEAVRARYKMLFDNSPQLYSTIVNRMVIGNKVIDHEHIVGRNGSGTTLNLVLVYEVTAGRIMRITTISAD